MNRWRWLGIAVLSGFVALLLLGPGLSSAPAPVPSPSSCVTCHTSRTALEPLVKPFPAAPAEGEG